MLFLMMPLKQYGQTPLDPHLLLVQKWVQTGGAFLMKLIKAERLPETFWLHSKGMMKQYGSSKSS